MSNRESFGRIYDLYLEMRRHKITFRIVIFLREIGIQGAVKRLFLYRKEKKKWKMEIANPTEEMKNTLAFLKSNKKRINEMLNVLEDEKSRTIWRAVMRFKATKKPIPKSLYSTYDQYFVKGIIAIVQDEVFIDGGAYIGDSSQQFFDMARKAHKNIKRIVMFEPNPENVKVIQKNFKERNVKVIQKGLYDEAKELKFELADIERNENTRIVEGDEKDLSTIFNSLEQRAYASLQVDRLDNYEECKDATFIKLCVEGSEMRALIGASEIIKRNRPKLAVCIYHNNENMIRIIEFIHELVPEYKIYVRHHTFDWDQTVMYAVL